MILRENRETYGITSKFIPKLTEKFKRIQKWNDHLNQTCNIYKNKWQLQDKLVTNLKLISKTKKHNSTCWQNNKLLI